MREVVDISAIGITYCLRRFRVGFVDEFAVRKECRNELINVKTQLCIVISLGDRQSQLRIF